MTLTWAFISEPEESAPNMHEHVEVVLRGLLKGWTVEKVSLKRRILTAYLMPIFGVRLLNN